mgnify:CR=1 FL=1|jgi:hypothetical protein
MVNNYTHTSLIGLLVAGVDYVKRQEKKETYGDSGNINKEDGLILGMSVGLYAVVVVVALAIWVTTIILLITNWKNLPTWAQVVGVLGLLPIIPMGTFVTLIVVLVAKNSK